MSRRRSSRRNARPKKSWIQKCKDCLRQFIAFLFSNVGIICLVVGYTLAGAVMFREIEGNSQDAHSFQVKLDRMYAETLQRLWRIVETWNSDKGYDFKDHTEQELKTFQGLVVKIVHDDDYDGIHTNSSRWSLYAAFLYCLTVITTIGYGNVFPHTVFGKLATVVYAIFGMPLFLLYLSNIGDLLAKSFKWLYAKFCLCKICRLRKRRAMSSNSMPRRSMSTNSWRNATNDKEWPMSSRDQRSSIAIEDEDSDDEDTESNTSSSSSVSTKDPQDVVVPVSLCLAIMIGFISLGALLFGREEKGEEGLSFLDGSYFCFISLSTIGFGDIVPPTDPSEYFELNFILCSIYLMLGMALIAMCFNLMQQDVVQKIRTCTDIVRRIARCRR